MGNKFYKAFFDLIVFGEWIYIEKVNHNGFLLTHSSIRIFNIQTGNYDEFNMRIIVLYKNFTYSCNDKLSMYENEILERYGFKKFQE